MGYMLGTCLLHSFVVEDEKDEYREALKEALRKAAKLIRSSGHPDATSIPIIALTANAFEEDVQKSRDAGMNAHLSKPVEPDLIFETLSALVTK